MFTFRPYSLRPGLLYGRSSRSMRGSLGVFLGAVGTSSDSMGGAGAGVSMSISAVGPGSVSCTKGSYSAGCTGGTGSISEGRGITGAGSGCERLGGRGSPRDPGGCCSVGLGAEGASDPRATGGRCSVGLGVAEGVPGPRVARPGAKALTGGLGTAGRYLLRNFLLRRVTRPDPSTRTIYL